MFRAIYSVPASRYETNPLGIGKKSGKETMVSRMRQKYDFLVCPVGRVS